MDKNNSFFMKSSKPNPRRAPWHARVVRKTADWMERLTRGRVVHVSGSAKGRGRTLSNFALAQFRLDGVKYASFEAFWQSLKFLPGDPMREKVAMMHADDAKRAGSKIDTRIMFYGGKILDYGSPELFELAKRAERKRFESNPLQRQALIDTGNARLIHWVGLRDSQSLPRKVFCRILMELRDEFRNEK